MSGITDPSEEYFKDGMWAWDGSVWRKQPLIWGFSDRWTQDLTGDAVGVGNATASTTPVPAGEIYVLQACFVRHNAGADKRLSLYLYDGAAYMNLFDDLTATTDLNYPWTGEVVLKEGDVVYCEAIAPGAGKTVYMQVWGYKMNIAA